MSIVLRLGIVLVTAASVLGAVLDRRVKLGDPTGLRPLHAAVATEDYAAVSELLRDGRDVDERMANGDTPLHYARSAKMVGVLLAKGAVLHSRNTQNETPLHNVHMLGAARALLAAGADPNARDHDDETPLHDVPNGRLVAILARAGARLDAGERTPLHTASNGGVVEQLLKLGADPLPAIEGNITPLHTARDARAVRALVRAGVPLQAEDWRGRSPLHTAKNHAVAIELLQLGADPNAADSRGTTPLMATSDPQRAGILLAAGADLEATDRDGRTALSLALAKSNAFALYLLGEGASPVEPPQSSRQTAEVKRALISSGADPQTITLFSLRDIADFESLIALGVPADPIDEDAFSPLAFAKDTETARFLIEAGANPNRKRRGKPAAAALIERRRYDGDLMKFYGVLLPHLDLDSYSYVDQCSTPEEMRTLLGAGASPAQPTKLRDCIIAIKALGDTSYQMAELLLAAGADPSVVHAPHGKPEPSLRWANRPGVLDLLLRYGARADVAIPGQASIFHNHFGRLPPLDICRHWIDRGADLEARDKAGNTALLWHAVDCTRFDGRLGCLETLLRLGADTNASNHRGWNALHYVISQSNWRYGRTGYHFSGLMFDSIELLLDAGVDPLQKDNDGKTPLDLCSERSVKLRALLADHVNGLRSH